PSNRPAILPSYVQIEQYSTKIILVGYIHKNRPLLSDRAKVKNMIRRAAKLVVAAEAMHDFEKLGMQPTYEVQEALAQAMVVIDCTPDGVANQHKLGWLHKMPPTLAVV